MAKIPDDVNTARLDYPHAIMHHMNMHRRGHQLVTMVMIAMAIASCAGPVQKPAEIVSDIVRDTGSRIDNPDRNNPTDTGSSCDQTLHYKGPRTPDHIMGKSLLGLFANKSPLPVHGAISQDDGLMLAVAHEPSLKRAVSAYDSDSPHDNGIRAIIFDEDIKTRVDSIVLDIVRTMGAPRYAFSRSQGAPGGCHISDIVLVYGSNIRISFPQQKSRNDEILCYPGYTYIAMSISKHMIISVNKDACGVP